MTGQLLSIEISFIYFFVQFSAVIWGCVDTLNKIISAIPNKKFLINRLRVLPVLADMLEISSQLSTTECILKMLQDITFGVKITIVELFLEKLIEIIVKIIIDPNTAKIQTDSKLNYNEVSKTAAHFIHA